MFFDAKNATETLRNFEPLPLNKYLMTVIEMEEKEDRFDNPYIKCVLEVIDGPYKNRKIFNNLYLSHPEWDNAVKAGRATLKSLCDVQGIEAIKTSSDLGRLVGGEYLVSLGLYKGKNIINAIEAPMKTQVTATKSNMEDVPL